MDNLPFLPAGQRISFQVIIKLLSYIIKQKFDIVKQIVIFATNKSIAILSCMVLAAPVAAYFLEYIMKQRVTFYIDGFNFYYGLKRTKVINPIWKSFYWINVVKLFEQFLGPEQELSKVIYFTASPLDPGKSSRQSAFLNANKLLNPTKFEIVRGKYIEKTIICPNPKCRVAISRPEEKKTDVNLSVRMLGDCIKDATDTLVLVSADSDLIPPVEFIQNNFKTKKVKIYFPPSTYSNDLRDYAIHHKSKPILLINNEKKFQNSIMPDVVSENGKTYSIPLKWK